MPPTLQPANCALPETVSERVMTHSFTMKDTDLSIFPKNVGLGVSLLQVHCPVFSRSRPSQLVGGGGGAYLTNRFESCNLLKMLMRKKDPRKHQSADTTRDVFEPERGGVVCLSGNFPSTLGLLEDATST